MKYVRTVVTSVAYFTTLLRRVPQADVVHAFSASYFSYLLAPLPAMIVGRLCGKKTLLNYHSGEADDHLARWRLTAAPTMRRLASLIVVPSGYLVDVFARHGLEALIASNSIPIEQLPYRLRTTFSPVFLSNRNHEELYNVACSIRAFHEVRYRYPKARLTIVGDGSTNAHLRKLVNALGLDEAVTFAGQVAPTKMATFYDAADIYLNSSNIDNMPLSIVESFACGLPVVSTDAGGIPSIVTHEWTGLLSPIRDHLALAASALRILESPDFGALLSRNARAECESKYAWSAVKTRWEDIYDRVASRAT